MFKTKTVSNYKALVQMATLLLALGLLLASCELIAPNKPPYAEILAPLGNLQLNIGETADFRINAYDVDGEVLEVQFFMNDQLLAADASEPYEYQFSSQNQTIGLHTIVIKAIDNDESFYTISKDLEIVINGIVSAGADTVLTTGATQYTLAALVPTGGTGTWSTVPAGLGSFSDIHDPHAVFEGNLCESYTLRWTVSIGGKIETDYMELGFMEFAPDARAGEDQHYTDGRLSLLLHANDPGPGTGLWTVISGLGGSFSDPADPSCTFTGRPCIDYSLVWTITTRCQVKSDTVSIRLDQVVLNAYAGADQSFMDGRTSTFLAGNDPGLFEAEWSIISGVGGELDDPMDPKTNFTGKLCETYVLLYRIVSGCGYSEDEVSVSFNHSPSTAVAGTDLFFDDGRTTTFLNANQPAQGEGLWSIVSGSGGLIDDATDPQSRFIGALCERYVLRWTILAGCGSSSDEMSVEFTYEPSEAYAGSDQFITDGNNVANLAANAPQQGQGTWSVVDGSNGVFSDVHSPTSQFIGQLCGSYILQWTISTGCGQTFDQVKIEFDKVDVLASAGPDQSFFNGTTSTRLAANDPEDLLGTWRILSGLNGSLSDVNDPHSTFSGIAGEVYILEWSIASTCGSSSDQIKVAFLSLGTLTDNRNGKTYTTVLVGNQEWMTQNLDYTVGSNSWAYDENLILRNEYGLLYNYEAAKVACPVGWHLPSDAEWQELENTLGMAVGLSNSLGYRGASEGDELKETGLGHWNAPNSKSVNLIGFKALPGGYRDFEGRYSLLKSMGAFWTSTGDSAQHKAIYRALHKDQSEIGRDWFDSSNAISVRCVKD